MGASSAVLCDSLNMCCGPQLHQPPRHLQCAWLPLLPAAHPSSLSHSSPYTASVPEPSSTTCLTASIFTMQVATQTLSLSQQYQSRTSSCIKCYRARSTICVTAPPYRWQQMP